MAEHHTCLPLTPKSIGKAHGKIQAYVHETPVLTSTTLDSIACSARQPGGPEPKLRLYFKCENYQRIGAFKARGAFHAILHLIDELGMPEVRKRGVVTHSSGNHAQALALAASTFEIPAYIVMPSISTPSKIAGTQAYTKNVMFSGSTSEEREAKVAEVIRDTNAIFVPPYDHPDILLGQGTSALELDHQYRLMKAQETGPHATVAPGRKKSPHLDLVIAPLGGGGLLSGTTLYFSDRPETYVFGAEPQFEGGDDGKRGLEADPPIRITKVKTLTIADGLRTPVGEIPWSIFTGGSGTKSRFLQGIRSVTEDQIKDAMKLVLERMKVFVEPSACVGLAALLYDEEFRQWIQDTQGADTWDVGVIFSGGNTTIDAITAIFGTVDTKAERQEGKVGLDGARVAENVAG